MAKKSNAGRPTVLTPDVIDKLEMCFANGGNDKQACLFAGIHPATLYNYQNENPEFIERKEMLKESVSLHAINNVARKIKDKKTPDLELSKWWLERRSKSEFSLRQELVGRDGGAIEVTAIDPTKLSSNAIEELMNARAEKLDYDNVSDAEETATIDTESSGLVGD